MSAHTHTHTLLGSYFMYIQKLGLKTIVCIDGIDMYGSS